MELAIITAKQVMILFFLILTGIAAAKTGILPMESKKILSNLLVQLVVPAMVLNSYMMYCYYFSDHGPDSGNRQKSVDSAVRNHVFQCSLYGISSDPGYFRRRGIDVCQRVCHDV